MSLFLFHKSIKCNIEHIVRIEDLTKKEFKALLKEEIEDFYNLISKPEPQESAKYITTNDLSKMYGVNPTTIWRWRNKGLIKAYGLGNKVFFRLDEIEKAIKPLNQ